MSLSAALDALPARYPGPGGAVAVLRDGVVLEQRSWGWADRDKRLPFTAQTLFPVCSITKQFTCALLLDQVGDPARLDAALAAALPLLPEPPGVRDLCHNQSGLRDYWALAMLCGADVDGVFGPADAARLFRGTRSLQFAPGTRYSYSNGNFRLLSDLIEQHIGRPFAELLRQRVLDIAGMPTAQIAPDTAALPGGAVGYEGNVEFGFIAAVNRIHWTGDAGLVASLNDMIAWERYIDRTRNDPASLYHRLTRPVTFRDGNPAAYGFGLRRLSHGGMPGAGHGGGLRGWRSERLYLPEPRLSVVVLFNHLFNAQAAATDLVHAALGLSPPPSPSTPGSPIPSGMFREPETGLLTHLTPAGDQRIRLDFARTEWLDLLPGKAQGQSATITPTADGVWLDRPGDNLHSRLVPVKGEAVRDIEGRFHAAELDATLVIEAVGGVLYGVFEGWLGQGTMHALLSDGTDHWRLPCPRALDYAAPGDWTLWVQRDEMGAVARVQVGCWLARQVNFERT
ncbi:D-aminopeptidase [Acidisphaera sp. L21]|uniref:D-aminopeptidase n=1 Tax=Acidisphaera sp. L21 TaxID=1641851 RepID=UPI0020B14D10|nr:D-aminopeptidase [Acidisphaera sp. L21]